MYFKFFKIFRNFIEAAQKIAKFFKINYNF